MQPINDRLLTINEVRQILQISPRTEVRLRMSGQGPAVTKIQSLVRFKASDVTRWLASQGAQQSAAV
jgi:predicted DNA-binding transcriptional regulator AlpA